MRPKKSLSIKVTTLKDLSQWPPQHYPEFVFAGRSNSGKSSLINNLLGEKLCEVGKTPGCTTKIKMFETPRKRVLVDLPGYGYAQRSHKEREKWRQQIEQYLTQSAYICCVVLVMDIRRDWKEEEQQLLEWLNELGIPCIVALTKKDKLSGGKASQRRKIIEGESGTTVVTLSNLDKKSLEQLTSKMTELQASFMDLLQQRESLHEQ